MSNWARQAVGIAQLAFDSVEGVTNSVERLHETIAATPRALAPGKRPVTGSHGMIAGSVYATIRGVNAGLRGTARGALQFLPQQQGVSQHRDTLKTVAALNGVAGDHLEETGNPLAINMSLRTAATPRDPDQCALTGERSGSSPHIVILVHGLALSELCWSRDGKADIGKRLAEELGYTPLYLRYNSGRHISTNGREFATLLDELCATWPVPVQSISLVGHSMGGLVIRSACWYAQQAQATWLGRLKQVVCLGSPHHGAPLEKAGHLFDRALLALPYTAPLAFGRNRSAGIKDLRHGNLLDEDWSDSDPDLQGADARCPVPLLENVDYYFVAATVGRGHDDPIGQLLGDLLVRLGSATGSHPEALRRLHIEPANCRVIHERHHFDLISDERVKRQIVAWLA